MKRALPRFLLMVFVAVACRPAAGQDTAPRGSLEMSGRIRIDRKMYKIQRKRFYVLRGSLDDNRELVGRLKSAEIISRDCFYAQAKASAPFICWLRAEDCDSPYCREVSAEDAEKVPEFRAAYETGLRQFGRSRGPLALKWLMTNLSPVLREGFFTQRNALLRSLLGDVRPVQSAMTDSVSVKAVFVDIPLDLAAPDGSTRTEETFTVSNILPLEIRGKSYLWACEVGIGVGGPAKLILKVPVGDKPVRDCEVFVRDLPVCRSEGCAE